MAGQKTDQRDVHVGQRIAEQRRKAALTQRRVAQSFGMSAAQLQKYEKGTNRISAVHLDIFSRMIGVPLDHFFQGMPRLDDGTDPVAARAAGHEEAAGEGFGEGRQRPYAAGNDWQGLAEIVGRHVAEHFSDEAKRDLAAAVQVIERKIGG